MTQEVGGRPRGIEEHRGIAYPGLHHGRVGVRWVVAPGSRVPALAGAVCAHAARGTGLATGVNAVIVT